MLTFRKSLITAVFFLVCFLLLRSSHSSSSSSSSSITDAEPISPEEINSGSQTDQEQSQNPKKTTIQQLPLERDEAPSLRDLLRYHFPYDLETRFPAYIWQTWKYDPSSVWFIDDLRSPEASWTEMHPGFVHQVITDDTQRHLIKYYFASIPEVVEAYEVLPLAVLKADFFRYLVLLARGGIYSDIDTTALRPAPEWLPEDLDQSTIGLVVGIEADPDRLDWKEWYSRRIQFCQWTIQAKPGHPVLRDIVAYITEETLRMKKAKRLSKKKMDKTIVEFTGPAAWTDAVFRYFNNPDYFNIEPGSSRNVSYEHFTNQEEHRKVGDVVVLPITSFSPGVGQMGSKDLDDPMAFVQHDFGGMFLLSGWGSTVLTVIQGLGRQTLHYKSNDYSHESDASAMIRDTLLDTSIPPPSKPC